MLVEPQPGRARFAGEFDRYGAAVLWSTFLADALTPVGALHRLSATAGGPARHHPVGRFLLESVEQGQWVGRYSFVGVGGRELVAFDPGALRLYRPGEGGDGTGSRHDGQLVPAVRMSCTDPLVALRERLKPYRRPRPPELPPFFGGAVGFFGYDVVRSIERRLGTSRPDALGSWMAAFLVADEVVALDHLRQLGYAMVTVTAADYPDAAGAYRGASERLAGLMARLQHAEPPPGMQPSVDVWEPPASGTGDGPEPDDPAFEAAVERAREYIRQGDIFQVVLSREYVRRSTIPPLEAYRRLRAINPSPYMFFLELADPVHGPDAAPLYLVGASPEIMVRLQGGRAVLRPIAGTRPRGADAAEDARLAAELRDDPKENAEHMMLVDLGRNDLGRVCRFGSVRVSHLREIERYSHVMHMVSQVEGELAEGFDALDLVRATFPAGTVSGAPKVRAMEIIDELEPTGRGPYAGAAGYLSFAGDLDSCITIRTLGLRRDRVWVRVGAGIVADSNPRQELRETHNKGLALLRVLEGWERHQSETAPPVMRQGGAR